MTFQQRRKPVCWFEQMIDIKGEDFFALDKVLGKDVTKAADRIINDIINGNIDYDKYGYCLLNRIVYDNLLAYCSNKQLTLAAIRFSLRFALYSISIGTIKLDPVINIPGYGPDSPNFIDYNGNTFNVEGDQRYIYYGPPTINESTINSISTSLRDTENNLVKYSIMTQKLQQMMVTRNVYVLTDPLIFELNKFINSTNKFNY